MHPLLLSRSKATVTGGAGEWPLARVGALVDNQVPLFAVSLGAEVARKWLCASVSQLVAGQLALAREHLAANVALDKPHGASPAHTAAGQGTCVMIAARHVRVCFECVRERVRICMHTLCVC